MELSHRVMFYYALLCQTQTQTDLFASKIALHKNKYTTGHKSGIFTKIVIYRKFYMAQEIYWFCCMNEIRHLGFGSTKELSFIPTPLGLCHRVPQGSLL